MPSFLIPVLIQVGVFIVKKFGVPFLEQRFPMLTPLLDEILKVISGEQSPSKEMCSAADHFAGCKNTQFKAADVKTV